MDRERYGRLRERVIPAIVGIKKGEGKLRPLVNAGILRRNDFLKGFGAVKSELVAGFGFDGGRKILKSFKADWSGRVTESKRAVAGNLHVHRHRIANGHVGGADADGQRKVADGTTKIRRFIPVRQRQSF